MRENASAAYSAESLSRELRTNASASASYIALLKRSGLLVENEKVKGEFRYSPATRELAELISKLATVYKIKPHKILELIFSPTKRARLFADAFSLTKTNKPGDENG